MRERNGDTNPARIVIGKDTHRSSYMFEYSLVAGLTASCADAYLFHVTTTPSVAYIARVDDFDCGIMISASHNPYYDNGIKLIDCYGEKMPEETLLLMEDYIDGKLHVFVLSRKLHEKNTYYEAAKMLNIMERIYGNNAVRQVSVTRINVRSPYITGYILYLFSFFFRENTQIVSKLNLAS